MVAEGAVSEARAAERAGASRTASAALGFRELIRGDFAAVKAGHRRYARRQMTWMRRMEGVCVFDRSDRSDREVAVEIVAALRGTAL